MARTNNQSKKAPSKQGRDNLKTIFIVVFVIGVFGIISVPEVEGKAFSLVMAVISGFLYWRKYKSPAKQEKDQPDQLLQQFQYQPSPKAEQRPAEFVNAAGHRQGSLYEFVPVTVAGVTFSNGRRQRQTILRQIYWKDEPYNKELDVTLRQGEYEGAPTVEVWVNEEQIGFVPKEQVPFFVQNWHRLHSVFDLEVSGGGKRPDGERVPFGATFTARFSV